MRRTLPVLALLVASAALACSSSGGDGATATDGPTGSVFLAFGGDFSGFHAWESYKVPADSTAPAGLHTSGPRTEYLNHRPPHGSTTFPVGTIIVKELSGPANPAGQIFAMVKRGGGFNASGASGWEWFELSLGATDADVSIIWRGVGPPSGEKYGGDPTGGCNGCHGIAPDNDSVRSTGFRLATF
jgi:hypothetical protein